MPYPLSQTRAYLDHNASGPLRPSAREAMVDALGRHGNASSVHGEGRDMRRLIEQARSEVAKLVGAEADGVIFTGSATEAAHLALTPNVSSDGKLRPAGKLYVLETEHPCVLAGGRFPKEKIVTIPVLKNGIVDLDALDDLLEAHDVDAPFVAIQMVNSETGIIQPVEQVSQRVRLQGGYTLCDAVQAVGRVPVDAKALGVDFLLLSAHKIGGPQGVGALVNVHSMLDIPPAIEGGGQEKNRRAGTENVTAIAGFGAAAKEAAEEAAAESANTARISALRDSLESQLLPICASYGLQDRLSIVGWDAGRVGSTSLFGLRGLKAETALIAFDLEGVAVSSGSACSSGKVGSSHVLRAMAVDAELAEGAIRVSLGWNSTQDDVTKFLKAFDRIAKRLAQNLGVNNEQKISGAA